MACKVQCAFLVPVWYNLTVWHILKTRENPLYNFLHPSGTRGPSLLLVGAAVVCLACLLLPTQGEGVPTSLPVYLHLHANVKIVLAYALGMLIIGTVLYSFLQNLGREKVERCNEYILDL